jgi:CheY-like chemotaxis protein
LKPRARILLVDDDSDFVLINRTVLEGAGYAVMTASSGPEGFDAAMAERPDLAILDVMMEEPTEGFDLARRLRADPSFADTRIILLTSINRHFRPLSFAPDPDWLPVDRFLEKPLAPEELLRQVKGILGAAEDG